jgi:3-methyladenine DNA glycosylase AlkD
LPDKIYPQLAIWNKDKDLWKRRQSVVSMLYFSGTKKIYLPFEKITALVEPLLKDKEYYVQKGVGWTLREMNTVYPKETFPFLIRHIKAISPIAFTIAIEKMEAVNKANLKALRKSK